MARNLAVLLNQLCKSLDLAWATARVCKSLSGSLVVRNYMALQLSWQLSLHECQTNETTIVNLFNTQNSCSPFCPSGQRNFWVQLCWAVLFIKQDPHLYSWGSNQIGPMQLFLGILRLLWSQSPKNQAWWCVLIIPELRRWRKEAILGYLVCSWPIEAFKGEAWTVPKESRPRLSFGFHFKRMHIYTTTQTCPTHMHHQ